MSKVNQTVLKTRKNTGTLTRIYLDKVSLKALQKSQEHLSQPNGVTYSNTAIMRRALKHYYDKIVSIRKNAQLLEEEARETRLASAGINPTKKEEKE